LLLCMKNCGIGYSCDLLLLALLNLVATEEPDDDDPVGIIVMLVV